MKKMLSIAACAVATLAFAETTSIELATVGVTKITSSSKETALAVSYKDFDSGNISVSNLVKTTNLTDGDQLAIFSGTRGQYETFTLQSGVWVKNDKVFTYGPNGLAVDENTPSSAAVNVPVGTGIWLVRNVDYQPGTVFSFFIYGLQVSEKTYAVQPGWNLIGNPLQSSATIASALSAPAAGDAILYKGVNYSYNATKADWRHSVQGKTVWGTPSIAPGEGFWYNNKSSEQEVLNWVEPSSGN